MRLAAATLLLDGEGLDTRAVAVDGEATTPVFADDGRLQLDGLGDAATITTSVAIRPQDNTELSGLYRSGGMFCTQCEAEGFRRITWFLDRPDVLSSFTTTIVADHAAYPNLLSNGDRISEEDLGDGRRAVTWRDPWLKPCYLFALVAGDLHCHAGTFTTMGGRTVACEIWVEHRNADRCAHALWSLQASMAWDERVYGREYDLDTYMIVAVDDFNMGAMENKGLNIFNSKYVLATPETATDSDYDAIAGVIAHEYFHNWTGNRVTCRDWFQLTLKEGLTVFRDQQFSSDHTSHAVQRIDDVRVLRGHQFAEDAGPAAHPIRPEAYVAMDNFYTSTVYNKGAEVIRMYHTLLGADGFRAGMDLYFQRHDGQAVTCDDFRAAMADANARDLTQFERWYDQAGTPDLHVTTTWDAEAGTWSLTLRQSRREVAGQADAKPYHIPVRLGLLCRDGVAQPLRLAGADDDGEAPLERVLELTTTEHTWTITDLRIRREPVPNLLRDFSAPVTLHQDLTSDDYALLAAHDSDPFNQWEACMAVYRQALRSLTTAAEAGEDLSLPSDAAAVYAAILANNSLDGARKALALSLPSQGELALEYTTIPVDALDAAHTFLGDALAAANQDALLGLWQSLRDLDPADRSVDACQQRRLRGFVLTALARCGESHRDEVEAAYASAGNMTDRMAALQAAMLIGGDLRTACLEEFYNRFTGDPGVIDKWFMIQATSRDADTVEQVLALREHPDFTLTTPNRVRSLIAAFSMNSAQFHRADGAGYQLLGDTVRALATSNPQLAARLAGRFDQWRR